MTKDISAKSINEAIGTVIAKLCYRAADDLGEELVSRTGQWRKNNAHSILQKANQKYEVIFQHNEAVNPRLIHNIIEDGSWCEQDYIQEMWAGLLVSSCSKDGLDESNLLFISILKQLTSIEVLILNHICTESSKIVSEGGWIYADDFVLKLEELITLTGEGDYHRIDRELDHLTTLGLLGGGGFDPESTNAYVTPSGLALQMYVRCQGYIGSPLEYWGIDSPGDKSS